jgi:HlyD family secretion protein
MKNPNKKTLGLCIATVLALCAALALTARAADDKKAAAPTAKPALTVTTIKPQNGEMAVRLSANGNIAAWQETIVGAEVNGLRLIEVGVNVGDWVKRGQVLAVFAAETVEADVAQQKAAATEAEAAFAEAQANATRARNLAASGALAAQQIEQYVTAAKTAEARLAAAQAGAQSAQVRLRNTKVTAQDDGVISSRAATVGAVAQPGQELFRMIRNNRLEWRAEVTAADLGKVKPGQRVALSLPGGAAAAGKVRTLAPTIDPQTRNAIVYVDLERGSEARAGMYAKGEFELGKMAALTVPQQAVVVRDGFSYVFTVDKENRVAQLKVKTGRRSGDRVEVLEGLKAEVPVVAAGAGFLNDGDLVAVAPSTATPAASATPAKSASGATPAKPAGATASASAPGAAAKK